MSGVVVKQRFITFEVTILYFLRYYSFVIYQWWSRVAQWVKHYIIETGDRRVYSSRLISVESLSMNLELSTCSFTQKYSNLS